MDTSYHQQLLEHTGKRIRFYRRLKKLSQDELATAIHKSESTLSKYERGWTEKSKIFHNIPQFSLSVSLCFVPFIR